MRREVILQAAEIVNELPFPAPVFGLIAGAIFTVLLLLTLSYAGVANRNSRAGDTTAQAEAQASANASAQSDSGSAS